MFFYTKRATELFAVCLNIVKETKQQQQKKTPFNINSGWDHWMVIITVTIARTSSLLPLKWLFQRQGAGLWPPVVGCHP